MEIDKIKELIEENHDIIYDNEFFDSLKSTSLLDFRRNINMVQNVRPSLYIEEKVNNYYGKLLQQYDNNSQMFLVYNKILECFKSGDYTFLDNYKDLNFFLDEEMVIKLQDYRIYSDRFQLAYNYLLKNTNLKISQTVDKVNFVNSLFIF